MNVMILGNENSVKLIPEKPKPGDEITVIYDSKDTPLASADKIKMTAYLYSRQCKEFENIEESYSVEMKKEKNLWIGKIKSLPTTDIIGFIFKNESAEDNNKKNGYFIRLYDKDGNETPGSILGYATALTSWNWLLRIDGNPEKAFKIMDSVFNSKPELKQNYIAEYLTSMNKVMGEKGKTKLLEELVAAGDNKNLREEDYFNLVAIYNKLGMTEEGEGLIKRAIKLFPNGYFSYQEADKKFEAEKDLDKKIELAFEIDKKFHEFFLESSYVPSVSYVFKVLLDADKPQLLNKLWKRLSDYPNLNEYALGWIIREFLSANKELDLALDIAKKGYEALELKLINNTPKKRLKIIPESEFIEGKKRMLPRYCITYAEVLSKNGKHTEALAKYEDAFKILSVKDLWPPNFEPYAQCLIMNTKYDEAQTFCENLLKKGNGSEPIKEILKKLYVIKNGNENGYDDYLEQFESIAKTDLIEKLKKEMINDPAPQFTLTDLEGKKVSLSDYQGKVVVVDFWATWCGPCKASFPAMQKAVNKFKDNKDIVFLFVNTWQTELDKKKNAEDFIKENKYTFHVLLDTENKVVADFKVGGIPTKFVIDKAGNIKFNVVGFNGSDDVAVEELSSMIELAGK